MDSALWPLATALLTTVFTVLLAAQWWSRRKAHQLWWTVGFAMYAASAGMEFVAFSQGGWTPWLFRVYAIVTAILVPVLAQGTLVLVTRRPLWGRLYLGYNAVIAAAFVYGALTTPLIAAELAKASMASYAAFGGTALTYPRFLSMLLTIPAAFVLFGGAAASIVRFWRKPEYRYRVWANVLIALATLVISSGGGLAKAGNTVGFYAAEMIAATLYFAGFLMAGTLRKGADAIREKRAAHPDAQG
jgi:hypothetical protein